MTTPLIHTPQHWEAALKQAQAINRVLGPKPIIRREERSIYQPDLEQGLYEYTTSTGDIVELTREELVDCLEHFAITEGWR